MPKIDSVNGERLFSYSLRAINADAHLVDYYYVVMNTDDYGVKIDSPQILSGGNMNFTTIIIPNEPREMMIFIERRRKVNKNFFIAMEFTYKSKGNKIQTPLRKVYEVYGNQKVREVDSYTFVRISLVLKRYKIWDKFYDL